MRRLLSVLVLLILSCGAAVAQRTTTVLRVRVINVRTGKPVRNMKVFLMRDQAYPGGVTPNAPPGLQAKTDANGTASFQMPLPLPPKLFFAVPGGGRLCSQYFYDSENLFSAGVVGEAKACNPKHQLDSKFFAQPGELILFVKPYTRWEMFQREIL